MEYRDNGEENGNYYLGSIAISGDAANACSLPLRRLVFDFATWLKSHVLFGALVLGRE